VRRGLRLILEDQPDINVVGDAADGAEAVALARQLRPGVCLVDIRMPRLDGNALISPSVTVRLPQRFAGAGVKTRPPAPVSERETDVVRAIARGRTNQEIAAELSVSVSTVKTHVASVQLKLGLRNRVEIAAWARENRLVV
jgi:DNA-binding NarL/FixJ family response regulator